MLYLVLNKTTNPPVLLPYRNIEFETVATIAPHPMIYLLPFSLSITVDVNPICIGDEVTFTSSVFPSNYIYEYQWYYKRSTGGGYVANPILNATGSTYTTSNAVHNYYYFVKAHSNDYIYGMEMSSNEIQMVVTDKKVVDVTISKLPVGDVCTGSTITFTASPTNGGSYPTYEWTLIRGINEYAVGDNSPVYTGNTFSQNDVVYCTMTNTTDTCITNNPDISNYVAINFIQKVTPTITISSENNVCSGKTITFNSVITYGGHQPIYQWIQDIQGEGNWINIPGATGSTYSYKPQNNDKIKCYLGSDQYCVTESGVTSNILSMNVYPTNPVSVSITANPSGVTCSGTQVAYTAIGINSGTTESNFQWCLNSISVSTGKTYSYIPINNDLIYCELTSDLDCVSGNPSKSNDIENHVWDYTDLICEIQSKPNCVYIWDDPPAYYTYITSGDTVEFFIDPPAPTECLNIGNNPMIYQWYINDIASITGKTLTYKPNNHDLIELITTSNCPCVSGSPYTSKTIQVEYSGLTMKWITISGDTRICSGDTATIYAFSHNYLDPSYQWYLNGTPIGTDNNVLNYSGFSNNDIITCHCIERGDGDENISNPLTMIVSKYIPTVHIGVDPRNNICSGSTATFYVTSSGTTNGGNAPSYQWYRNENIVGDDESTYRLYDATTGDQIYVEMTSSLDCAIPSTVTSNTIIMYVSGSTTASVTIEKFPSDTVCTGETTSFVAFPFNGGSTPRYQWYVNNFKYGAVTFNPILSGNTFYSGDEVYVEMTSNANCVIESVVESNRLNVLIEQKTVVVLTISGNTYICTGETTTFYATTNITTTIQPNFVYEWYLYHHLQTPNLVGTGTTYTSNNLLSGDTIYCVVTGDTTGYCLIGLPAYSNYLTMIVNQKNIPEINIIVNPTGTTCQDVVVLFSVNWYTYGGDDPTFQWKYYSESYTWVDLVGETGLTMLYYPSNVDQIKCTMVSDPTLTCITTGITDSNILSMSVESNLPVSVTITASPSGITCSGTSVTYTANGINSGSTPTFDWYVNAIDQLHNYDTFTYIPSNDDFIALKMTSSIICTIDNPSTAYIIQEVLPNQIVDIEIESIPVSTNYGGIWYCEMVLNNDGISLPELPPVSFVSTVSGVTCDEDCEYHWYLKRDGSQNEVWSGSTYILNEPLDGDMVWCDLVSHCQCIDGLNYSTSKTINIRSKYLSILSDITNICTGETITFTAYQNGYVNPHYQWYITRKGESFTVGTDSTIYSSNSLHNGDIIHCTCTETGYLFPASSNGILVYVTDYQEISVNIESSPPSECLSGIWRVDLCSGITNDIEFVSDVIGNSLCNTAITYEWYLDTKANQILMRDGFTLSFTGCTGDLFYDSGGPDGHYQASEQSYLTIWPELPNTKVKIHFVEFDTEISVDTLTVYDGPNTDPEYYYDIYSGDSLPPDIESTTASGALSFYFNSDGDLPTAYTGWKANIILTGTSTGCSNIIQLDGSVVSTESGYTLNDMVSGLSYRVWCEITSNCRCCLPLVGDTCSAKSKVIYVFLRDCPDKGVIIYGFNDICQGDGAFYAYQHGYSSPYYTWYKNNVDINWHVWQYFPSVVVNDYIRCDCTESAGPPYDLNSSNTITIIGVTPKQTVDINIESSPTSLNGQNPDVSKWYCDIIVPANDILLWPLSYTAPSVSFVSYVSGITCEDGGIYQWYLKITGSEYPVSVDDTYVLTVPTTGEEIWCKITSNCDCIIGNHYDISKIINLRIKATQIVANFRNTIYNETVTICTGSTLSFMLTSNSTGYITPIYQWHILRGGNFIHVGTNSNSYSGNEFQNGDIVTCETSETGSYSHTSTSNSITVIIQQLFVPTVHIKLNPINQEFPLWIENYNYEVNDTVQYDYISYICIKYCPEGHIYPPLNLTYWTVAPNYKYCSGTHFHAYIDSQLYQGSIPYYQWQIYTTSWNNTIGGIGLQDCPFEMDNDIHDLNKIRVILFPQNAYCSNTGYSNEIQVLMYPTKILGITITGPSCIPLDSDTMTFISTPHDNGTDPKVPPFNNITYDWAVSWWDIRGWLHWTPFGVYTGSNLVYTNEYMQCMTQFEIYCRMTVNDFYPCIFDSFVDSNTIHIHKCTTPDCGDGEYYFGSQNEIFNGGALNTTNFVDSNDDGLADDWSLYSLDHQIPGYGIQRVDTYIITDIYARILQEVDMYFSCVDTRTALYLKTPIIENPDHVINNVGMYRYDLTFDYNCWLNTDGSHETWDATTFGVLAYFDDIFYWDKYKTINIGHFRSVGGYEGEPGNDWEYICNSQGCHWEYYPPQLTNTTFNFTMINSNKSKLKGLAFYHTEPPNETSGSPLYFTLQIGDVNLTECKVYNFSDNIIENGGGDNTTDWYKNGLPQPTGENTNLADGWASATNISQWHYIGSVQDGSGFDSYYQRIYCTFSDGSSSQFGGIKTNIPFDLEMGCQKYFLDFQFRSWAWTDDQYPDQVDAHLGVWADYSDNTQEFLFDIGTDDWGHVGCVTDLNPPFEHCGVYSKPEIYPEWTIGEGLNYNHENYMREARYTNNSNYTFTIMNTPTRKLTGLTFGHYEPATIPSFTFIFELDHVNLWKVTIPELDPRTPPSNLLISGYILESDLTPCENVKISFTGSNFSGYTDAAGYYSKIVPYGYTGRATPFDSCNSFNPSYIDYTNIYVNQENKNYEQLPTPTNLTISGRIYSSLYPNTVFAITFTGHAPIDTDINGYYTMTIPNCFNGTATPSSSLCVSFSPPSIYYGKVSESKTNQDYTPWPKPLNSVPNHSGEGSVIMYCFADSGSSYEWYAGEECTGSFISSSYSIEVFESGYYSCKVTKDGCNTCATGYALIT